MEIRLSPQQKLIFDKLRSHSIPVHYNKLAEELGISAKGCQSQLSKLKAKGLIREYGDNTYEAVEQPEEQRDAILANLEGVNTPVCININIYMSREERR